MSGSSWTAVERLGPIFDRSRAVGFLGPGAVEDQIRHAQRFHQALERFELESGEKVERVADLGSGGGVPGLAVLAAPPERQGVLIDASNRRCAFLVWAVAELGLADRVDVWCGRAEAVGHEVRARGQFDAVIARGFGPPATTVECAAPLVREGGVVVVSEPPHGRVWPAGALADVGLVQQAADPTVAVFARRGVIDQQFPRASKAQKRDPLF